VQEAAEVNVTVTISVEGTLVLSAQSVTARDIDADGVVTINDALYCAHEQYFEGDSVGYGSEMTEYGISMTTLWGKDYAGAYGYYLNNASAWSLADPVKKGDYVAAFAYQDTNGYSDQYSFFSKRSVSVYGVNEVEVTLQSAGFDADWNPVTLPVVGAAITVNGKTTDFITDENGVAKVTLDNCGVYEISAVAADAVLVPPVGRITVSSFADTCGMWAEPEIETVVAAGLFGGLGKGFEPNATMTRAQLVMVLYRLEGEPAFMNANMFTDVPSGSWYEKAVVWADGKDIISGYGNGKFGPADPITREQLVTVLHNYAKYKGYDVSVGEDTNILSYDDVFNAHSYAIPALQWACGAGILNGKTATTLNPIDTATRAQVAVMMARFMSVIG